MRVCQNGSQAKPPLSLITPLPHGVGKAARVRGNIRKKLGLGQDDDLRKALLDNNNNATNEKNPNCPYSSS